MARTKNVRPQVSLVGAGIYQIYSDRKNPLVFFDGNYGDNIGDGEQIIYGISTYYQTKYPGCVYPLPMPTLERR